MLTVYKYIFLKKLLPKKFNLYYKLNLINSKKYFKNLFGNLLFSKKYFKNNKEVFKNTQNFFKYLIIKLDQTLLQVGFFKNLNVAKLFIKNSCIFINGKKSYLLNYNLKINDIVYLGKSAYNLVRNQVNYKKLI